MNVFLWMLQLPLSLLALAGGSFKVFMFEELSKVPAAAALPRGAWAALGVFEMLCGVLLVIPVALGWKPSLTPLAATALAIESFGLAALYARHSTEFAATNPLVWVVAIGLVAAIVAYGRYALTPLV